MVWLIFLYALNFHNNGQTFQNRRKQKQYCSILGDIEFKMRWKTCAKTNAKAFAFIICFGSHLPLYYRPWNNTDVLDVFVCVRTSTIVVKFHQLTDAVQVNKLDKLAPIFTILIFGPKKSIPLHSHTLQRIWKKLAITFSNIHLTHFGFIPYTAHSQTLRIFQVSLLHTHWNIYQFQMENTKKKNVRPVKCTRMVSTQIRTHTHTLTQSHNGK